MFRFFSPVLLISLLASCGNKQPQQQGPPPPVAVTVQPVTVEEITYFDEYPATVTALNEVELRAQVNGYITGIHFKDGDRVTKGQRLYTIDAQVYNANEQQAIANLQVQETNLIKAQKDADRYHELEKQDAIARQQVDYADAALEAARKQVAAAKAQVQSVKANVGFTTIVAPFNGRIGLSQVRMGGLVSAGSTLLNTVSSTDPIAVDFPVNEKDVHRFISLQQQAATERDSLVRVELPGGEVYPWPGRISALDRAVNSGTGAITVRASFPNKNGLLITGMNTTIKVINHSDGKQLVIPYRAVTEQLGQSTVYVVSDSSTAEQRKVLLGQKSGDKIVVKEGVSVGEQVITEGVINIRNGAKIVTEPAAKP